MNHSEIVKQNLVGLNYYPNPFPSHVWDQEFEKTDVEMFKKAIKKIRSTFKAFPTYSDVREVMAQINAEEAAKWKSDRENYQPTTRDKKIREVFWKWYDWLGSHATVTDEILVEYYAGCADDYRAVGGNTEFYKEVEKLYVSADEAQKRIDGRKGS